MTIPMSSETTAAKKKRQELEAAKPGAYTSAWQGQMDDTMGQIMDRKPFSYDLDGDALYQNYKDRYTQQGRMAMMDTMGQAAGLTGGYGSSYAQQVGQQAYQGYMQQLSDVIPELYSLAYDRYQAEGQELKDRLSLLGAMDDRDYGRHRDTVSDWYTDLGRADDDYYQLMGMDNTNYWNQKEFDYQASRDAVKDAQWRAEFEEAKRRYELELEQRKLQDIDDDGTKTKTTASKFISEHMTLEEARSRGITDQEYKQMVRDWMSGFELSENDISALISHYRLNTDYTDRVKKFIAGHMSPEQAEANRISRSAYTAMIEQWINGMDVELTDGEIWALNEYYGLGLEKLIGKA